MKKVIPILLLFVFFLFQAGRMLVYLECRITTPNCDCVKVLVDTQPGQEAVPNHKHLSEEFELLTTTPGNNFVVLNCTDHVDCTGLVPAGVPQDVFHPPAA